MKYVEFYPKKQGRPYGTRENVELESGRSVSETNVQIILEEQMATTAAIEELMAQFVTYTQALLAKLEEIKLHMASVTDEEIEVDDVS